MRRDFKSVLGMTVVVLLGLASWAAPSNPPALGNHQTSQDRIYFARIAPTRSGLFIADSDGSNERSLAASVSLDYNPSFSLDGSWIIFTSEREGPANIYRVHPDGSGLERLTDGRAFADQAAMAPGNKAVAFVSTRGNGRANIWVLDLKTRRQRDLTHSQAGNFRPSWSPDGKWIAFTSDRDEPRLRSGFELTHFTALYVMQADGSALRRLTEFGELVMSPKWSEDGKKIIVVRGSVNREIVSIDFETGAQNTIAQNQRFAASPTFLLSGDVGYDLGKGYLNGGAITYVSGNKGGSAIQGTHPSWSPDGQRVVYERNSPELFGPSEGAIAAYSRDARFALMRTGSFATFSSDGRQMLVAGDLGRAPGDRGIVAMDANGRNQRTLFEAPKGTITSPSWSPDGNLIAFGVGTYFERPVKSAQIAIMHSDGSGLRYLTQGETNDGFPSFSPDGTRIVYRVLSDGAKGLRILSLQDGYVTELTHAWDNFPAWSPCDNHIVFTRQMDNGDFEIFTIDADGSNLRQVTRDHGNDAHASWSPDGKRLLFTSSRQGWKDEERGFQPYGELFVINADGSGLEQLTDNQWEDATGAWLPSRSVSFAQAYCRN